MDASDHLTYLHILFHQLRDLCSHRAPSEVAFDAAEVALNSTASAPRIIKLLRVHGLERTALPCATSF
jgi:hypothetical protein